MRRLSALLPPLAALGAVLAVRWAGPADTLLGLPPATAAVVLANLLLAKACAFRLASGPQARPILQAARPVLRFGSWFCLLLFSGALLDLGQSAVGHVLPVVADPQAVNAMEGRETVKAWLLTRGVNIYPAFADHPFLVTIYPPVYHLTVAAACPRP